MHSEHDTFIAFDFGMRFIGVAVGQTLTCTASPLPHLLAKNGEPDWDAIAKLIKEWKPKALIVGIPFYIDGTEHSVTHSARNFANKLKKRFKLPVHGVDERFSTVAAKTQLFEKKGYKGLKKGYLDSFSAKLILESWLTAHGA